MFAPRSLIVSTLVSAVLVLMVGCSDASNAAPDTPQAGTSASSSVITELETPRLLALLKLRIPQYNFVSAQDSGVPGIKSVVARDPQGRDVTIYVSADGQHLLTGKLFRVDASGLVDVQDEQAKPERIAKLSQVAAADMITYKADNEKTAIWAFTDVNCGYCKRFHASMQEMNDLGITVHYLAFPVIGDNSMPMMMWAWCQPDRKATLDGLKNGSITDYGPATCEPNPVNDQYRLGMQLGVTGTPAIFLADGTRLPGAVEPSVIAKLSKI